MALETQHYIMILAALLTLRELYQYWSPEDVARTEGESQQKVVIEEPGSKFGSIVKPSTMDPEIKFLYCSS